MKEAPPKKRRYPNFDVIRIGAASSVIFSHAFVLADGSEVNDPLVRMIGPNNPLGIYGVFCFFIMSGFLVSRSVSQTGSLKRLLMRRILRIYPALIICSIICGLIIAAFFFQSGPVRYWESKRGLGYIVKLLLLLDPLYIDGVAYYQDTNWLGGIINGSLWTLLQEAQFYGVVIFLAAIRLFNAILPIMIALIGTILFYMMMQGAIVTGDRLTNLLYSLAPISTGMAMYFIYSRIGKNRLISLACIIALAISFPFGLLVIFFPILAAYPLIHLGMSDTIRLGNVTRFGDVTYGTYLYGWPIQQIIRSNFVSGISGWSLFLLSWPLALLCGWLSWHLIERHFTLDRVAPLWTRALSPFRHRYAAPAKLPE